MAIGVKRKTPKSGLCEGPRDNHKLNEPGNESPVGKVAIIFPDLWRLARKTNMDKDDRFQCKEETHGSEVKTSVPTMEEMQEAKSDHYGVVNAYMNASFKRSYPHPP